MKPKFEFGDIVECVFAGQIEGEPVTVRKRLFVQGVSGYVTTNRLSFTYHVCENDPSQYSESGRVYQKEESELIELEPVVQATERANRKFVAPAVNQIYQCEETKKLMSYIRDAQKQKSVPGYHGTTWGSISSGTVQNDYSALSNAASIFNPSAH